MKPQVVTHHDSSCRHHYRTLSYFQEACQQRVMAMPHRIPDTAHISLSTDWHAILIWCWTTLYTQSLDCLPAKIHFALWISVYFIDEAMDFSLQKAVSEIQLNNYISGMFTSLQAPYHGQSHCSSQWYSSQPLYMIIVSDTCMFPHFWQI